MTDPEQLRRLVADLKSLNNPRSNAAFVQLVPMLSTLATDYLDLLAEHEALKARVAATDDNVERLGPIMMAAEVPPHPWELMLHKPTKDRYRRMIRAILTTLSKDQADD